MAAGLSASFRTLLRRASGKGVQPTKELAGNLRYIRVATRLNHRAALCLTGVYTNPYTARRSSSWTIYRLLPKFEGVNTVQPRVISRVMLSLARKIGLNEFLIDPVVAKPDSLSALLPSTVGSRSVQTLPGFMAA